MSAPTVPSDLEILVSSQAVVAEVVTSTSTGFDPSDEAEQHALFRKLRDVTSVDPGTFLDSWRKAFRAVEAVFTADEQSAQKGPFVLESVTAKLSLTASGKVAFVGELGGEVAFEACFRRST